MPNGIRISKEAFLHAGNGEQNSKRDAQREMLFDGILALNNKVDSLLLSFTEQKEKCNGKFDKLEKRKNIDKGFAGAAGVIGGFIASFFKFGG